MLRTILRAFRRERGPWCPRAYRVTETAAGADINYDCYCGCDAGFAFERSAEEPAPEHCCCGNAILVGADAEVRLPGHLDDFDSFRIDVQSVEMPWDDTTQVALAIPTDAGQA